MGEGEKYIIWYDTLSVYWAIPMYNTLMGVEW